MTNIYAPPSADLGAPPEERIPRPVSLFLLQAVATVFALLTSLVVILRGFILVRESTARYLDHDIIWFASSTALCILLIGLIIGLQRRSKIARFMRG
ncbi:hypothetical protein LP420_34030 [Massilia sp. B-10]|nr:hypothetical protein LP420_34030 [Massilia sp. B-10]